MTNPEDLLAELERHLADLRPEQVPAFLVRLAACQTAIAAQMIGAPAPNGAGSHEPAADRWLTVPEACEIARVKPQWFYVRSEKLSFLRRLSRKKLLVNEAGLRRYLAAKRA